MAYILQGTNHLAFVCSSTTLLFNKESNDVSFIQYPDVPARGEPKTKNTEPNAENMETDEPKVKQDDKQPVKNNVLCACMSTCGNYLAINDDEKRLIVWKNNSGSWGLQSNRLVVRKCIKIKFTKNAKYLLAADKGGDVYQYSVEETDSNGKLIFGHLSMLLDIIITPDDKYVITCDRDEKIRVSNFPNCYNIHTYCLGHTQFVTSLALTGDKLNYLLSGSGDGTIRVWNYLEGEEIFLIDVNDVIINNNDESKTVAVKSIVSNETLVAVLFDGNKICAIFKFFNEDEDEEKIKLIHLENINFEVQAILASIINPEMFLVLTPLDNDALTIYKKASNDSKKFELVQFDSKLPICLFSKEINSNWSKYKESMDVSLDTQILYKQWFDNMEVYQEKKRQRLEKKNNNSKPNS